MYAHVCVCEREREQHGVRDSREQEAKGCGSVSAIESAAEPNPHVLRPLFLAARGASAASAAVGANDVPERKAADGGERCVRGGMCGTCECSCVLCV